MSSKAGWQKALAAWTLAALAAVVAPVFAAQNTNLLGYQPPENQSAAQAVLYFRYLDSPYLGQESREVSVPYPDSPEKALVQALLDGPRDDSGNLKPLFPEGTEVLSVLLEGDRLFVTFNSSLLEALPGENQDTEEGREKAVLRRELAMASLVNTLTQSGGIRSVQVLVYSPASTTASMRLSRRYYLEDSDALPDPLLREESRIVTPGVGAGLLFGYWKTRDRVKLEKFVYTGTERNGIGGGQPLPDSLPQLTGFQLTEGSLEPSGMRAVVVLSATFLSPDGQVKTEEGIPVVLWRQDSVWKIARESIRLIVEASE